MRFYMYMCLSLQAKLLDAAVVEAVKAVKAGVDHKMVGSETFIRSSNKLKVANAMSTIAKKHGLSDPSLLTFERLALRFYDTEEEVQAAEVRI